jgi:hypothetical protein
LGLRGAIAANAEDDVLVVVLVKVPEREACATHVGLWFILPDRRKAIRIITEQRNGIRGGFDSPAVVVGNVEVCVVVDVLQNDCGASVHRYSDGEGEVRGFTKPEAVVRVETVPVSVSCREGVSDQKVEITVGIDISKRDGSGLFLGL